jgi:CRISPR-associated endonuclease/helicase Cas3
MQVFSHSKVNKEGKREGNKLLIQHLKGVHEKAISHFSDRASFYNRKTHKLLDVICWLHDLGKYTKYFQTYLLYPEKADHQLKAHSNLGAQAAFKFFEEDTEIALLAFYLIKMHHSNLMNLDLVLYPDNKQYSLLEADSFKKQVEALSDLQEFKVNLPQFNEGHLELSTPKALYNLYKKQFKKSPSIERYFKTTYLFSLLIEADKLDASDTQPYPLKPLPQNAVDERVGFGKPQYPAGDIKKFSQNELRNFVRSEVVTNLDRKDILEKRIFTLAAPTGIGKTMTSLDFVLKLRHKIEQTNGYFTQVIYGLPFINIIEQALDEYEKTLGSDVVIGHYQYADIFGKDGSEKIHIDDEEFYNQRQMVWDTWQKDVVITSFVQLFETLIGNRNKLLKKFRHFADSIIILDEVQTLAIEKLPVIGAALYYLCKYLNARVVIMTATQPKLFELMSRVLKIAIDEEHLKPFNLLNKDDEVFACFNRTKIIPLIDKRLQGEDFLGVFDAYWQDGRSCLIVVNKVNRSIEIYRLLKERFEGFENIKLFYLSTNITPIERQQRVEEIKKRLPNQTCILISTQVVEAGVDLDFDIGFRDLGPIDSIVQVAGRINRENSEARKGAPLYIVDFGDCGKIYGYATDTKARKALQKPEIHEEDYKSIVEQYFEEVSDNKLADFKISMDVFDAMQNLKYAFPRSSPKRQITISDFKIIEESQNGIPIFVELPNDHIGTKARKAFEKLLFGKLKKSEFDQDYKRDFNQRIISVPDYYPTAQQLKSEEKLGENIYRISPSLYNEYYDEEIGFKRTDLEIPSTISF